MDEASHDDLRQELARLEDDEARVSAQRRHLHRQIDFGFASDEARAREREISDERRELHRRIDELRELLGMPSARGAGLAGDAEPQGVTMRLERDLVDDAGDDLESQHLP
jgi:uncharacterized protein YlxW (UPF0749 family)